MSVLVIDTDTSVLWHDQTTQLEGVEYVLDFYWSARESAWYLGIYDQDEDPIAVGIRLNVGWPLLRRFRDPRLPAGLLMCVDMSDRGEEIAEPGDLGRRVLLTYTTSDDASLA